MKTFYVILTFCMGLFAGYLLFNKQAEALKPPLQDTLSLQKAVARVDYSKTGAEQSLKRQNELLKGQLAIADARLRQSHTGLERERKKLRLFQDAFLKDTLCGKNPIADSLRQCIDAVQVRTDSLLSEYRERIRITEMDCALRDSGIVICNRAYHQLMDLSEQQVLKEQMLTRSLNEALKQQRRKRFQNRLLAGGMLFISGVAASLILHTKQ